MSGFRAKKVLEGLSDFQRRTVEHVFGRLYGPNPTRRYLVADEVGLGKTFVAKGLIAKTIERLQGSIERIDVVYICSNVAIAKQNIDRLNVLEEGQGFNLSTRLTLLPKQVKDLRKNSINFVSLTPGTAFGSGGSRSDSTSGLA